MGRIEGKGKWFKRKTRGKDGFQWIWKFERPFKESDSKNGSRATVFDRGTMEIWFNMHPEGLANVKKTEELVRKRFRELFNVKGRDICEVFTMLGFTRVAYYCRMAEPPADTVMEKVAGVAEDCYVEAEVSRWDAETGEYQGTYYLTEFDYNTRFHILKQIEGNPKAHKTVKGSKWRLAN